MSWSAHEFENYFIQKHVGVKASFIAITLGNLVPDYATKKFVYASSDPAMFHRGWPGIGFTHSFVFGAVLALAILVCFRSRTWALGLLIGQWAHVLSDAADSAGVMPFFPFSTEPVALAMWNHSAVAGRYGDGAAYYSSLGGVWDFAWFLLVVLFARRVLRADYFRTVVMPADQRAWSAIGRRLHLTERGLLVLYRGFFVYGFVRMTSWFLYARFDVKAPWEFRWAGPSWVVANDLSAAGPWEVVLRTTIGGVLFFLALWLCWRLFVRRLWDRAALPRREQAIDTIFATE